MLDIFRSCGVDSYEGLLAALILSSTETLMYTISIYYMSVKVTGTRWTVAGALFSMAAGIVGKCTGSGVCYKNVIFQSIDE